MWQKLAESHLDLAWRIAVNWRRTLRATMADDDLRSAAWWGLCEQARWFAGHGDGTADGFRKCLNVGIRWRLSNEWKRERRWRRRRCDLPLLPAPRSLRMAAVDLVASARPGSRAVLLEYLSTAAPVREIARRHGLTRHQVNHRLRAGLADLSSRRA